MQKTILYYGMVNACKNNLRKISIIKFGKFKLKKKLSEKYIPEIFTKYVNKKCIHTQIPNSH